MQYIITCHHLCDFKNYTKKKLWYKKSKEKSTKDLSDEPALYTKDLCDEPVYVNLIRWWKVQIIKHIIKTTIKKINFKFIIFTTIKTKSLLINQIDWSK